MGRDITKCHPKLQDKANELIFKCKQKGINIKIGECVRTVEEQDDLYAKGRTAPGIKVTNAKGSSYSSMHQWGIAFDFYLDEDVDKDGKTSDDAFNDSSGLFEEVGKIGKSIGLEWGGGWKSIKDRPHFQLPDWGSTTDKLKKQYKVPANFFKTWSITSTAGGKISETSKKATTSKALKVEVICTAINLRKSPSWNDSAKSGIANKGDTFTVKAVVSVEGSKMYQLTNGKYISASEKYVKAYKE